MNTPATIHSGAFNDRARYDAIVVGARPAGAATAMLLARAGLRVLVVDRGRYGADTMSTHALLRGGVLQLHRWGLLDHVRAAGTPPIRRATFVHGDETLPVDIKPAHGVDALYAPRRTVLDPIIVDAACAAGADVRFGVTVRDVVRDFTGRVVGIEGRDHAGRRFSASAPIVVGADGARSQIAQRVNAPIERRARSTSAFVYGYWSGVELDGYEWVFRPEATAGVIPTNDGLVCVFAGSTPARIGQGGRAAFESTLYRASAAVAQRVLAADAVGPVRTFTGRPGHMRRAWGPGWALVGDAGYWKDPLSAHGLTDAMRDAELLARAIVDTTLGVPEHEALAGYQITRDRLSVPLFELSDTLAEQRWTSDEIGGLLRAVNAATNDEVELLAALDPIGHPASALAATGSSRLLVDRVVCR